MFIIGDEGVHKARFPWVTFSLIAINILAFSTQRFLGERFTYGFSLVPYEISHATDLTKPEKIKVKVPVGKQRNPQKRGQFQTRYQTHIVTVPHHTGPFPIFLTLFTSMFLHGDLFHLIGNMWFLAVFGRNVEHALDHGRFLGFYVACGIVGGLAHVASDHNSIVPCLGASGAISGIMGAYVAIYPMNKIKIWLGLLWGVVELPAWVVVGVWFLFQYMAAIIVAETGNSGFGGVAYWDHIGGFLTGVFIIWGTIWYLKTQLKKAAVPEAEADPQAGQDLTAPPTMKDGYDPFRQCMPTAGGAKPADPYAGRWS